MTFNAQSLNALFGKVLTSYKSRTKPWTMTHFDNYVFFLGISIYKPFDCFMTGLRAWPKLSSNVLLIKNQKQRAVM